MTIKVVGDDIFVVNGTNFAVSPSASGYQLCYSADGTNFTAYPEAVPANENLVVNESAPGMFYKLDGNTSTVSVKC